jgi:hypothetical protein
MKQPGDNPMQGIAIDRLSVHPDITAKQAVGMARDLALEADMDSEILLEGDHIPIVDGEFVAKAIDFRRGDMFVYDPANEPMETHKVSSDHNHTRGIEVMRIDAEPGDMAFDRHDAGMAWDEFERYGKLWLEWLRGNVVPVRSETRYVRTDTGQEVDV